MAIFGTIRISLDVFGTQYQLKLKHAPRENCICRVSCQDVKSGDLTSRIFLKFIFKISFMTIIKEQKKKKNKKKQLHTVLHHLKK